MAEAHIAGDLPKWQFMDPSDGGRFHPESGFTGFHQDHDTWDTFDFCTSQLSGSDGCMDDGWSGQNAGKLAADFLFQTGDEGFHGQFMQHPGIPEDLNETHIPNPLEQLLRSTSQLATERALFMHAPISTPSTLDSSGSFSPSPYTPGFSLNESPSLDTCSSPESIQASTNGGDEDQVFRVYALPDGIPHEAQTQQFDTTSPLTHREKITMPNTVGDCFTPLEMPDGSTRFTTNWLPVDPEGGFPIDAPASQNIAGELHGNELLNCGKDTFFSAELSVSNFMV